MSTTTTTRTYTTTHTAAFLSEVIRDGLTRLMEHLGLSGLSLSAKWSDTYESAIKAWIEEQSLKAVVLECTAPNGAVHRFDFPVTYTDGSGTFRSRASTVVEYFGKIERLPSQSTWRVVCTYRRMQTPQPGWSSTTLAATQGLALELGTIGKAPHGTVGLTAYGS